MSNNRYIRQIVLDEIGVEGQDKLLSTHVVVVGCGGLGSIVAPYLAGAGIGKITLVDGDIPDVSNLHRQVFFGESIAGLTKSRALAKHIDKLNSEVELVVVELMLNKENIENIIAECDIVVECTDDIQTKYLVNDYCHIHNIPLVYGAIHKVEGYVSLFENVDADSIHLRDIFAEPNTTIPTCSEVGVIGTIAGMIGILQANEVIKFVTGAGSNLIGQLLTYNIMECAQMKIKLKKNYRKEISSIYQDSQYLSSQSCHSNEITVEKLNANRSKYLLVSILENQEHQAIDHDVIHIPLSTIEVEKLAKDIEQVTVFYCKTGVRSGSLVSRLKSIGAANEVYSLAGGIDGV